MNPQINFNCCPTKAILTQNKISKENTCAKILFFYRATKHYSLKIKIQHITSSMNQINMDSKKNYKITRIVLGQPLKTYIQPYLLNNREYSLPYNFYFLHSLIATPVTQNKMSKMEHSCVIHPRTFFKNISLCSSSFQEALA